jgi:SHS2 domain-containing protein
MQPNEHKRGYRYFEERYTADIGFEAFGPTLEDLLVSSAEATMNIMVHDLSRIAFREEVLLQVEAESREMLLFDFLQELIFYKDAQDLLLLTTELELEAGEESFRLRAKARGERMDPGRHELLVDVKAVTLHDFLLEETEMGWRAVVVLDI